MMEPEMETTDLFYLGINGESAGPFPSTDNRGLLPGRGLETGIWNGTNGIPSLRLP